MNANIPPQIVADDPAAPTVVCNPAALTPEDIQSFIAKAILGEPGRRYKINPPPVGRSVRVYAGGMSFAHLPLPLVLTTQSHDRHIRSFPFWVRL